MPRDFQDIGLDVRLGAVSISSDLMSEQDRSSSMRWALKWIVVAIVALAAGGAAFMWARRATLRCATRGELTPRLEEIRYKFRLGPATATDVTSTIRALEAHVKVEPVSPMDLTDLADAYLRQAQTASDPGAYDRAEATARQSLAILPFPNGATLVLAKVANAKHQFREAIRLANEFSVHKSSAGAKVVAASAYLALGQLAEAAATAEEAVALKPDSSTYLMRALVLQAQGRDAEAGYDFGRSIALEVPDDVQGSARSRVLWGRFLLRRGETAGAGALFDEALRIAPEHPLALAHRAELALRTGDHAAARAGFERAFATSRQVRYLIDLARAQELAGDVAAADQSRAQVEKIVRGELAAHGVGHKLDLVEVWVDRGKPADLVEAIALGREEVETRPSADTRFQLARALARSGAREQAAVQVRAALATGVRDARLYELASRVEDGPRKALYAREAAKLDPRGTGWRTLGMAPPFTRVP